MDLGLQGKVAIVTGGSDGVGLATARRLAAEGAAVAICGRDEARLKSAGDKLRAGGAAVLDVPADVTRAGDIERLVSQTLEGFGTSVSRAAGLALTKALSKELAPDGILVNAICIGLVKSGQWERRWARQERNGTLEAFYEQLARERGVPLGCIGEAEELGALVTFLVSAPAGYITGVAVNFDGGLSGVA